MQSEGSEEESTASSRTSEGSDLIMQSESSEEESTVSSRSSESSSREEDSTVVPFVLLVRRATCSNSWMISLAQHIIEQR